MKKISFLINTANNTLEYVKLLLKSLDLNLVGKEHEILIFVDSDNENTVDYLKSIKNNFHDLKIVTHKLKPCVGYARNINLMVELARHDIVSFLQSDMVIGPDYDVGILNSLEPNCVLSSTRIEPPLHGESGEKITYDFGLHPEDFKWNDFVAFSNLNKSNREISFFFAPFTFYKNVWLDIGGHDTRFRRSREDSDILNRLVLNGTKIKQTFQSNVYHFTCVSSRGKNWFDDKNEKANYRKKLQEKADEVELTRFMRKWGSFSHGHGIGKKYDVDCVPYYERFNDLNLICAIEPMFSRIWCPSEEIRQKLIELKSKENSFANELLNFTEQDWENSKKYYNQTNYEDIFKVGLPEDYKVLLLCKHGFSNFRDVHTVLQQDIDVGSYEFGESLLRVKKIEELTSKNIAVKNPEFDKNLLEIL